MVAQTRTPRSTWIDAGLNERIPGLADLGTRRRAHVAFRALFATNERHSRNESQGACDLSHGGTPFATPRRRVTRMMGRCKVPSGPRRRVLLLE